MCLQHWQLPGKDVNHQLGLGNLLGIILHDAVLGFVLLGLVVGFEHLQLCHLNVQVHLLLDTRIAGCQHLYFCIGQCSGIHIFNRPGRGFAGHDLADKFLLVLHQSPVIGIKGTFGHIAVDLHLFIQVAPAHDTSRPLL